MFPQQLEDLYSKPHSAYALKKPEDKLAAQKSEVVKGAEGKMKVPANLRITIDGISKDVQIQTL